jgi:GR25 family glycosyltransferase involved in LPS biosynthesis
MQGILDYFDRLEIIHLPEREDRLQALTSELSGLGIDIHSSRVRIPDPPMPEASNGFRSRGVYGNFLSHLEIIEGAYRDGLDTVWVLEDDAIFSRKFQKLQATIAGHLQDNEWDLCFIGHSVWKSLPDSPTGLLRFSGPFVWAHSYAVHRRIMPRLIAYFRDSMERDAAHPEGGKLYIDAALFLFRQLNPDVICVVSSPCASIQKGSQSSLSSGPWYQKYAAARILSNLFRGLRDECWRQGWIRINGPQNLLIEGFQLTNAPAEIWPNSGTNHTARPAVTDAASTESGGESPTGAGRRAQ